MIFHFRLLPTDPRFQALTQDQIGGLYNAYVMAMKAAAGQPDDGESVEDPTFDDWTAKQQEETRAKQSEKWPADEPIDLTDSTKWLDVP